VTDRAATASPHPTVVGGRYRLLEEVGRGGMATVHRAHDEVLDRSVAVKLLHAHLARDPQFLDRFRREARAAAALAHPNVVAVHDWGETDQGPYLVLQLVEGVTLRDVLRQRRRLDPAEALGVLGAVAQGLAAAHRAGLVHRDVKPENVLLDTSGAVLLTDFGLARAAASATTTFGADVLVGSPHYLSPEAVQGLPLDPRADVYALGIVLYECLVGRPPHEGESPFATAVAHTVQAVPPPSDARAEVPPELDEVVLRATVLDRDRRYPDAAAFGRALSNAVGQGPRRVPLPDAPPPSPSRPGATVVVDAGALRDAVADEHDDGGRGAPPPPPRGSATEVVPLEDTDTDDLAPQRRGGRGWLVLVVLLGLVGGSALGGYLLWDRVLAPITPIPDVLSDAEEDARSALEAAGFTVRVDADRPHDRSVPVGAVLDQRPVGQARSGSEVTLVLSSGPRPVTVPDVHGDPADAAVETLRAADLGPRLDPRYDEEVEEGLVIATEPGADATVDEGSPVTVVVSLGPAPIVVPDVRGLPEEEALATLVELGLQPEVTDRRDDASVAEGRVLGQRPGVEATLRRGDRVTLSVSNGPPPVTVPSVRSMRVDDAVRELEALGLEVTVERRGGFGSWLNPDRVYDQSPGPDAQLRPGSTVLLYAYEP
jgi:beta-lactam-binding protein with PASTA domain/tRNA A-37 threonylcarbamoyl transferase component Bud32